MTMKSFFIFIFLSCLSLSVYAGDLINKSNRYIASDKDGTVTDTKTDLVWQRCNLGQTWDAKELTCNGIASKMNWRDVMEVYGKIDDCQQWRLPNITELNSIIDYEKFKPATDSRMFPKISQNWYWSSTPFAYFNKGAWLVNFFHGYGYTGYKSNGYNIRLVRGCSNTNSEFIDNKDGTITDVKTNLTWQRCSIGQSWNALSSTCNGIALTFNNADSIKLKSNIAGKNDWRLPTIEELQSIVDYEKYIPALNTSIFPNTPSDNGYWSSSSRAENSDEGWHLHFDHGYFVTTKKFNKEYVRLVR